MKKGIKKSNHLLNSPIKKTNIDSVHLSFSFKYLDIQNPKFCIKERDGRYFNKVIERLCALSQWTAMDLRNNKTPSLRAHPIDFPKTSEKNGFPIKNPELIQNGNAYQFEICANEHGRIHGLFIDAIFYVIWFDKDHKLYS